MLKNHYLHQRQDKCIPRLDAQCRERQEEAEEVCVVGLSSSLHTKDSGASPTTSKTLPVNERTFLGNEDLSGEREPKKEGAYKRYNLRVDNKKAR